VVTLIARLDLAHRLTEARWMRSSEKNAWSTQPALGLFALQESDIEAKCRWYNKIQVMDPDQVGDAILSFLSFIGVPFFFLCHV
jgi:hypothetical protein